MLVSSNKIHGKKKWHNEIVKDKYEEVFISKFYFS